MNSYDEIKSCFASRKKVRTVNPLDIIARAVRLASQDGYGSVVKHGGGVPNCYKYPADSECGGAIAVRKHGRGGVAYFSYALISANKITNSGAAAATLGERAPWDSRMGTEKTAEAEARLREIAWKEGDIRWIETSLGGLFYRVPGYRWKSLTPKYQQVKSLSTKRAIRAMRRICPAGWSVVMTPASQGAKPSPAWKEIPTGEEYHISADGQRWVVIGSLAEAAKAFVIRRKSKEDKELALLLDSGRADNTYVCFADSLRAGNCRQGTETFAVKHHLDSRRHYTSRELLPICNGDARFVRAAILAALRRERAEEQRGFALLSEHQA